MPRVQRKEINTWAIEWSTTGERWYPMLIGYLTRAQARLAMKHLNSCFPGQKRRIVKYTMPIHETQVIKNVYFRSGPLK